MPLLCREGNQAFTRLQEEILKHYEDYTLFLWRSPSTITSGSVFADSPRGSFSRPNLKELQQSQFTILPLSNPSFFVEVTATRIPTNLHSGRHRLPADKITYEKARGPIVKFWSIGVAFQQL
jgi:hypothetical protein